MDQKNSCLAPRVFDILCCISTAIHNSLLISIKDPQHEKCPGVWSEVQNPMGAKHDLTVIPPTEEINKFLTEIWDGQRLSAECAVMTIAYVDRFAALTGIKITTHNWRRIVLAAAIVASKVWEDLAVWNADFLTVFPTLKVNDLNNLESQMLKALQFVVSLKASLYCKYYFDLRCLVGDTQLPVKALSQDECKTLEARTQTQQDDLMADQASRSVRAVKSEGMLNSTSNRITKSPPGALAGGGGLSASKELSVADFAALQKSSKK